MWPLASLSGRSGTEHWNGSEWRQGAGDRGLVHGVLVGSTIDHVEAAENAHEHVVRQQRPVCRRTGEPERGDGVLEPADTSEPSTRDLDDGRREQPRREHVRVPKISAMLLALWTPSIMTGVVDPLSPQSA